MNGSGIAILRFPFDRAASGETWAASGERGARPPGTPLPPGWSLASFQFGETIEENDMLSRSLMTERSARGPKEPALAARGRRT